jgi:hypothetical protein
MSASTGAVSPINLSFRPKTYFWPLSLSTHVLSSIKGAERRALAQEAFEAGGGPGLAPELTTASLTDEERLARGGIHPAFFGGEFLPNLRDGELEVARITLQSVTQDVARLCARRGKNRIYYTVVDEYGGDTLDGPSTRTSAQPLTLAALADFFLGAYDLLAVLEMNFGGDYSPDTVHGFFQGSSEFYPDFDRLLRQKVNAWLAEVREPDDDVAVEGEE